MIDRRKMSCGPRGPRYSWRTAATLLACVLACDRHHDPPIDPALLEEVLLHRPLPPPEPEEPPPPPPPPGPEPTQLSIGRGHACVRMSDETVRCWGANERGQLGAGFPRVATEQATPPIAEVLEVAAGGAFTCARLRDRSVWCWGEAAHGELGTAAIDTVIAEPTQVPGIAGAVALAAGATHACALRDDGTAWCWGANAGGQLGDGSKRPRVGPVQVQGLAGATAISAGRFTCARRDDATLACWGPDHGARATPLHGLSRVVAVDVGAIGCAALEDGTAHCWGANDSGQLGRGDRTDGLDKLFPAPAPVAGLTGVASVAAATTHACARDRTGGVVCWGDQRPTPWSPAGCRHPTRHRRGSVPEEWHFCARPTPLPNARLTREIAMGDEQSCILRGRPGEVWCWGDGDPPARVRL